MEKTVILRICVLVGPVKQVGSHLQQGYTQYLNELWMHVRCGMFSQKQAQCEQSFLLANVIC